MRSRPDGDLRECKDTKLYTAHGLLKNTFGPEQLATGTEVFGRTTVHGQAVDPRHEEPLSAGQRNRQLPEGIRRFVGIRIPSLQHMDISSLEEITLIQASRISSNWTASGTQGTSVCNCRGSCVTNRCKCQKQVLKCSTKCHSGTFSVCQNKI